MIVLLIIAGVLITVLSYYVYNLSKEVRQLKAHTTELRNGIDEADSDRTTMRIQRDEARNHIKATRKEIEEAIDTAKKNREKITELLGRLEDYIQKS